MACWCVSLEPDYNTLSLGAYEPTSLRAYEPTSLHYGHTLSSSRNVEESALAKMMWREQLNDNWPGPVIEAKELCARIGVEDVNTTMTEKAKYIKIVEEACRERDETEIKKE